MLIVKEDDVVDRRLQQKLFQELVEAQREARVYLIRDEREGCGKSTLVKRLRWNCLYRVKPRPPMSLVDLEDFDHPRPFSLIQKIGTDLGAECLPEFTRLEDALARMDPTPFAGGGGAQGYGDFRGSSVQGNAQAAGVITNLTLESGAVVNLPEIRAPRWSEELRPRAERAVVSAFFNDLRSLPADRRAAIFIDSVDAKAKHLSLVEYVLDEILDAVFLDRARRPENAVLCIAGRDLPDYQKRLQEDFESLVLAPELYAGWERSDTEEFLKLILGEAAPEPLLTTIHDGIVLRRQPLQLAYHAVRWLWPAPIGDR